MNTFNPCFIYCDEWLLLLIEIQKNNSMDNEKDAN